MLINVQTESGWNPVDQIHTHVCYPDNWNIFFKFETTTEVSNKQRINEISRYSNVRVIELVFVTLKKQKALSFLKLE